MGCIERVEFFAYRANALISVEVTRPEHHKLFVGVSELIHAASA